jgi:hypothetical protein
MRFPAYRRRPDVLWRRSLDAVLLLPRGSEDVVTVGGTGADVWALLDTWRDLDSLVTLLAPHYSGDRARIAADVQALLRELEGRAAVEAAAESGGVAGG